MVLKMEKFNRFKMRTMTDEEIINKHSIQARPRARFELQIINQLLKSAEQSKYRLKVTEFEDESDEPYDVKTALFDLDDSVVDVYDSSNKYLGWIRLVFGNYGYDLISDYTVNLDDFLSDCTSLANKLEAQAN